MTQDSGTATLYVNDERLEIATPCTIASLLESLELRGGPVAVELNHQLIPSDKHHETILRNEDRLEVVSLTGGG